MRNNAVILCSGGLDSVVTAHYVKKTLKYKKIIVLFFNYNQKALLNERKYAKICAKSLKAKFIEISLPSLGKISKSLINKPGKVSKITKKDLKNTKKESDKWYVPFRNTIFISYALSLAESLSIKDIFLGFKSEGKEPFPDTTSKYLKQINNLARTASKENIRINAPLIGHDKEDIILLGKKLNVNLKQTFSCYLNKNKHCGYCLACQLRKSGFYWANIKDPTEYLTE